MTHDPLELVSNLSHIRHYRRLPIRLLRYFTIAKAIAGELGESHIAHRDLAQWEMVPWRSTTQKMDQVSKFKSVNSMNQI